MKNNTSDLELKVGKEYAIVCNDGEIQCAKYDFKLDVTLAFGLEMATGIIRFFTKEDGTRIDLEDVLSVYDVNIEVKNPEDAIKKYKLDVEDILEELPRTLFHYGKKREEAVEAFRELLTDGIKNISDNVLDNMFEEI